MFNFFKNKLKKPLDIKSTVSEDGRTRILLRYDEEVSAEQNVQLLEIAGKAADIPVFKGQVAHLYESDFTGYKDKCPRCGGAVTRMFSNFAYATQDSSRLLAAHAGLFCQSCPTVIIDDDVMRESIDRTRFEYRGVFSVESGYDALRIVDTINGVKPVVILSEDQQDIEGFLQSVHQPKGGRYFDPKSNKMISTGNAKSLSSDQVNAARKQKAKKKAKNKMAKQSKKAGRKSK
jgi:hypothetical protein